MTSVTPLGVSSGPAPTPKSPPSNATFIINDGRREESHLRDEAHKYLMCVCSKALVNPLNNLDNCRLHLPCYDAFRVKAESNLRHQTCWSATTVGEADRWALREHSDEVIAEATTAARRPMPAEGGGRSSIRSVSSEEGEGGGEGAWYAASAMDSLMRSPSCRCPIREPSTEVAL